MEGRPLAPSGARVRSTEPWHRKNLFAHGLTRATPATPFSLLPFLSALATPSRRVDGICFCLTEYGRTTKANYGAVPESPACRFPCLAHFLSFPFPATETFVPFPPYYCLLPPPPPGACTWQLAPAPGTCTCTCRLWAETLRRYDPSDLPRACRLHSGVRSRCRCICWCNDYYCKALDATTLHLDSGRWKSCFGFADFATALDQAAVLSANGLPVGGLAHSSSCLATAFPFPRFDPTPSTLANPSQRVEENQTSVPHCTCLASEPSQSFLKICHDTVSSLFMATGKRYDQLGAREIEHRIAEGQKLFIFEGYVVKADSWLNFHPGGDKIILHMVGKDATDEVTALHSQDALRRLRTYRVGTIEGRWNNFVPPIQGGQYRTHAGVEHNAASNKEMINPCSDINVTPSLSGSLSDFSDVSSEGSIEKDAFDGDLTVLPIVEIEEPLPTHKSRMDAWTEEVTAIDLSLYPDLDSDVQANIIQKYRELDTKIRAEGLYNCNYKAYAYEISRYVTLFALCVYCLKIGWYIPSAVFLGLFWHQLVFSAHDAGHMGITHNYYIDTSIGIVIADFLGGLSIGWWKRSHNIHHVVTNLVEHDPDVELMPFFALSHRMFESLYSTFYDRIMPYDEVSKIAVQWQHYLYYPILMFGRFNLYRLSWEHIIFGYGPKKGPGAWTRYGEIAGQVFFWYWFGYCMLYKSIPTFWYRVAFVLISHMTTAPLHVQITLSHYAMSTADLGVKESFPQRMLRTTMDVECPEWLDFIHGGLQFQAIHHLFPRMPRHNLRRTQKLVQGFCDEVKIPYALHGFVDGNKKVIGRLGDIGRQAAILAKCQEAIAGRPLGEHH